jgi:hypothetical protein
VACTVDTPVPVSREDQRRVGQCPVASEALSQGLPVIEARIDDDLEPVACRTEVAGVATNTGKTITP